jgi:hypothetical protein
MHPRRKDRPSEVRWIEARKQLDSQLDAALADTFPCSDPVSSLCAEQKSAVPLTDASNGRPASRAHGKPEE